MKNKQTPAFIISGTSSGAGKTTVSLGLMAAFSAKGYKVQPFKCGPDFIDPGLHKLVTGNISRNIDVWMTGEDFSKQTLNQNSSHADLAIIEGVMGMLDGGVSSSASLSALTGVPNILVIDVRSMAESAAAIVRGFETFSPEGKLAGVLLNRVASTRHLQLVSDAITEHCSAKILGHLPRDITFEIPGRHLGLLTADESPISQEAIEQLSQTITRYIDLDALVERAAPPPETQSGSPPLPPPWCRIGVARDRAFCFYYEDNLDILRAKGAELVFFSPMEDRQLPEGIDGLYLGGGYPELYAQELSENTLMLDSVRSWIENNGTVYAECGGFMYLTRGITDYNNTYYPMVGVFPVIATINKKRTSLGYRELTTREESCWGPAGTILRGHEFHYSTIGEMPKKYSRIYKVTANNGQTSLEGYSYKKTLGGYMHLHLGYNPDAAAHFLNFCRE